MKQAIVCIVSLVFAMNHAAAAQPMKAKAPEVLSVYPLGGVAGSVLEVKVRGKDLQDVRHVWFDCAELQGEIRSVHAGQKEEVTVNVRIGSEAKSGIHVLRLFSPFGVSGPLAFM
jgi:hypothetical protein